ncbi:MAG TPA: hypothetical protein VFJ80_08190 [Candidatus Limnocylindrales bacterium]|nr:hypothetical protein [Candidatus Limnocylindrales bacterium]
MTTRTHSIERAVLLALTAIAIAACGGSASGRPVASARPDPTGSALKPSAAPPSVEAPVPSEGPSADPTVEPSPAPTAHPPVPAGPVRPAVRAWSRQRTVFAGDCGVPAASVDAGGRYHVVASCDTRIRYAVSADGRTWTAHTFARPAHRLEVDPQVAVDGRTLYLAYTRLRPVDGGCGDDGLTDVGVYYRTKRLPDGAWSAAVRIGHVGDHLQSFRVVDRVIHETFVSADGRGPVSYGRQAGSTFSAIRLPEAVATSLRIGDDGRPRIAFTTQHTLRLATVGRGGKLAVTTLFDGKDMAIVGPSLVLGAGNRAYLTWTAQQPWGGGCADGERPYPRKGVYFGTDASGAWQVKRLSSVPGASSIALDPDAGIAHTVISQQRGLRYLARDAAGAWSWQDIPDTDSTWALAVRHEPRTDALLVLAQSYGDGSPQIVAIIGSARRS